MRLLLHTAATPALDLALEEAIHLEVEEGRSPNTWRLWQPGEPAAVIGTGQEAAKEVNLECARAEGVPVLRRHSGGGAVVIGPGCIHFSSFYRIADMPGAATIRGAMSAVLRPVVGALAAWNVAALEAGSSDLAVNGSDGALRKIAGNSQARKKFSVVVHGTLLADPDWERLGRLLPFPTKAPDYRAGRTHRDFLTSLKECGAPAGLSSFTAGLLPLLPSDSMTEHAPSPAESARAEALLREKYANKEWNFRR